jgi:PBP1b-binding outer membrane lipoprotein LpoB
MKGKKLFTVIVTLMFLLSFAVSCTSNQAAPAMNTNPTPAQTEQPQATPTPVVSTAPTVPEKSPDEKVVYISASKLKVRESAVIDGKALDSLIKGAL